VPTVSDHRGALAAEGFARVDGHFARPQDAWSAAREVIGTAAPGEAPLAVIGDFVVPPPDGPPARNFQTLHLDFGVPLDPVVPADVARFTALHFSPGAPPSGAVTRLVPLRSLLAGGSWPDRQVRRADPPAL